MKKSLLIIGAAVLSLGQQSYAQEIQEFDRSTAIQYKKQATDTIQRIEEKLQSLDQLFPKKDKEHRTYLDSRKDIIDIIDDMKKAKSSIGRELTAIGKYQSDLKEKKESLKTLKKRTKNTKDAIIRITKLLYELHNEVYTTGTIDNIKLFTKIDNITDLANQDEYMGILLQKLETLMQNIEEDKKIHQETIKNINTGKSELERHVAKFQTYMKNTEKKIMYLEKYMDLLETNKEKINTKIANIVKGKQDIENQITKQAQEINNGTFKPLRNWQKQKQDLEKMKNYGAKDVYPLSWPILPIQEIKLYFHDKKYQEEYNVPYNGIQVNIAQGKAIHAAQDGVVTHASNSDMGINRITIAHRGGLTTSYLYISEGFVKTGDLVRKGHVIARSGGESGTRGAGFFSQGTSVTLLVTKDGRFVDPLALFDLSSIKNEKIIPRKFTFKYKSDIEHRPIDLTKLTTMAGETERERQEAFLGHYAKGEYQSVDAWEKAGKGHNIDSSFVMCIGFAESSLGNNLTTNNNIGNVGNPDDPSIRTNINGGAVAGISTIYDTLDNRMLGHYNRIDELSRYRREDKKSTIYASSTFNRQNNILKCLTRIKGYDVPEDFAFRTGPRTRYSSSFESTTTSLR